MFQFLLSLLVKKTLDSAIKRRDKAQKKMEDARKEYAKTVREFEMVKAEVRDMSNEPTNNPRVRIGILLFSLLIPSMSYAQQPITARDPNTGFVVASIGDAVNDAIRVNCVFGCDGGGGGGTDINLIEYLGVAFSATNGIHTRPGTGEVWTVSVNNFPASFSISNFPATQAVTQSGTWSNRITDGTDTALVSAGGSLMIECTAGCGGAPSFTDNSAFTGGTTAIGNIGALYDTTPPAITDGNAGTPRMDSSRYLYTVFPSAQAISGTVSVNIHDVGSITTAIVPGTAATNLGKAEDAAHTTGDVGVEVLNRVVDGGGGATELVDAAGDYTPPVTDRYGAQFARVDHPNAFNCGLDAIGTTMTQCQAAPAAGFSIYITDVVAGSTTSTAGLFILRRGTGTNCGTGTVSVLPSAATVARIGAAANTSAGGPTLISFNTPLKVTAANALCVLGVVTNTTWIQITGFIAR